MVCNVFAIALAERKARGEKADCKQSSASKMPTPTEVGVIKFYFIWCVIFYEGKDRCSASIHPMKDRPCHGFRRHLDEQVNV